MASIDPLEARYALDGGPDILSQSSSDLELLRLWAERGPDRGRARAREEARPSSPWVSRAAPDHFDGLGRQLYREVTDGDEVIFSQGFSDPDRDRDSRER